MMTHVFRGKTLMDAKRNAYRELGDSAVIVTTRNVARNGIAGFLGGAEVEVSAVIATEETPAPERLSKAPGPFNAEVYRSEAPKPTSSSMDELAGLRAQVRTELRAFKGAMASTSSNDELFAEVSALRTMIEDLHAAAPKYSAAIRASGIEGAAAVHALARASKKTEGTSSSPNARLRAAIADVTFVTPWPLANEEKTMIALVGPSGVGKTTTAAKLGAQARMRGQSVLFVACDSYRVGAVDQLRRYADLLSADIEVAVDSDALDDILRNATADVVIVDTAGRGAPAEGAVEHRLAKEVQGRARHVLLCLTASIRAADADRMCRQFSTARPTALAITKIDETSTPAGIVHASVSSKLPVSTLCFGQRVPEDIGQATTAALVDYVIAPERGTK